MGTPPSRGFLDRLIKSLRSRDLLLKLGSGAVVVVGFAVVLASFTEVPALRTIGGVFESAPPGTTAYQVNVTNASTYLLTLVAESCSLEVFPLDSAAYDRYLADGSLPPDKLDCSRTSLTFSASLSHIVSRNAEPSANVTFWVDILVQRISRPYALISILGFALVVSGIVVLSMQLLQRGIEHLREELSRETEKYEKKKQK